MQCTSGMKSNSCILCTTLEKETLVINIDVVDDSPFLKQQTKRHHHIRREGLP